MNQEFDSLSWHDAELKDIIIDRSNDNIRIIIQWPEQSDSQYDIIEFFDCYAFQADMHFGFVPPDCILEAECSYQSEELDKLKQIWKKMGLDLPGLKCFKITTNSTNSTISFYALGFRIIENKNK